MARVVDYYVHERRRGQTLAVALHVLVLLLAIFGLPSWMLPRPPEEPSAITVEIVPITGVTNIKPSEQAPAPQPNKEPKPDVKPIAKETPPVKTAEPPPPPPEPKPEPKPEPAPPKPKPEPPKEKPPEPKPEPKPTPKPDKKPDKASDADLDAVLKAVQKQAQKEKQPDKPIDKGGSPTKSRSNQYNPNLPMSLSEKDAIRSQMAKCWSVPAGSPNAQDLVVTLRIELAQDGKVLKVELANESKARYNRDTFFRAAADSAIRAVYECSPLQGLPPQKYETWRDMEMSFDPKEMLF